MSGYPWAGLVDSLFSASRPWWIKNPRFISRIKSIFSKKWLSIIVKFCRQPSITFFAAHWKSEIIGSSGLQGPESGPDNGSRRMIRLEVIEESVNPLTRTYSSALTQNCIRSPCKSLPLHVVCQLLSVKLLVSLDNSAFSWFCDLSERFFEQNNQILNVISNILRARK